MPATIPSSMGQSRCASRLKLGPAANCQTLVTNDGTMRSEAAFAGAITRLSKPIETVGRPSPTTPFTKPASRKVRVAMAKGRDWMEGMRALGLWDETRAFGNLYPASGQLINEGPRGRTMLVMGLARSAIAP